jgi:hypothetical protein
MNGPILAGLPVGWRARNFREVAAGISVALVD